MLLRVDEHMGQVHIVAFQRLARRRTLGVREQRVEFVLELFEAKLVFDSRKSKPVVSQ